MGARSECRDVQVLRLSLSRCHAAGQALGAETVRRPGSLDLAIARRSVGNESVEQLVCRLRHLVHRTVESELVSLGGPCKATQLAHELQGGRTDLLVRGGWFEVMQSLDVPTHLKSSSPPN